VVEHKYGMRFYEFATAKPKEPKKPKKPLTPEQSLIAARKRDVDVAKQAMQSVKDHQKRRREMERARKDSYIAQLQKRQRSK
jgi:hypothetical protein